MARRQIPIQVVVEYRTPTWLWKSVAFPFHATHYMLMHTSNALCTILGHVAQELMVKSIERKPLTKEQWQEILEYDDEEHHRVSDEFAQRVDHDIISSMEPPMEGYR